MNNRQGKPKGISRMDNPETLGTTNTQSTGRRLQEKNTYKAIQKTKKKHGITDPTNKQKKQKQTKKPPKKPWIDPGVHEGSVFPFIV